MAAARVETAKERESLEAARRRAEAREGQLQRKSEAQLAATRQQLEAELAEANGEKSKAMHDLARLNMTVGCPRI